jgi:hypothetical protein
VPTVRRLEDATAEGARWAAHPRAADVSSVQAFGIDPELYLRYADRRWGAGWKINPHGRARAWNELERYRNDPQGYLDKIESELQAVVVGSSGMIRVAHFSDLHYGTRRRWPRPTAASAPRSTGPSRWAPRPP